MNFCAPTKGPADCNKFDAKMQWQVTEKVIGEFTAPLPPYKLGGGYVIASGFIVDISDEDRYNFTVSWFFVAL